MPDEVAANAEELRREQNSILPISSIEELIDSFTPASQITPYFDGDTPEGYWNRFSEDNYRGIAHILYLENAPNYQEHLNYIFDYGRSYPVWRNLWDNYRNIMVNIRNRVYSTMSNMTVSQSNDIGRILNRNIEHDFGLNSNYISLLSRWMYTLHLVYSDGSVPFPTAETYYESSIDERLRCRCLSLMRYISASSEQYSHMIFSTLDARLLYLSNTCRTIALIAREAAHSYIFSDEDKEYIRYLLTVGLDINVDRLYNLMCQENNLGDLQEIRQLATVLYHSRLWAPFENPFLEVPCNYEVSVTPIEGEDAVRVQVTPFSNPVEVDLSQNNDFVNTINNREALTNLTRILGMPDILENLSDSEVEIFTRNYIYSNIISDEVISITLPATGAEAVVLPATGMESTSPIRREEHEHALSAMRATGAISATTGAGFTGGYTTIGMTGGEIALNSQGVCNLNDLANAHACNNNSVLDEYRKPHPPEQEVWEDLQKNHADMMETIQYIIDDCTVFYKEKDMGKRTDKLKEEMVPRIRGVLTAVHDRLTYHEKFYIEKWVYELVEFAINCNRILPRRKLAPKIYEWDQTEEPKIKKKHTPLWIIPRLSE